MAKTYLTPINLSNNELQNFRIQNLATAPSTPSAGLCYYDTTLLTARVWTGTVWVNFDPTKASAGTIPLSTLNGLYSSTLDQFAPPAANLNINARKLTNLGTPTVAGDAAEYSWVVQQIQSSAAGISSKMPVKAVSTANLTTSAPQTVDGVSLVAGDRCLLTAQTTTSQNGVWIVQAAAWTRSVSEGATAELDAGATWLVMQGTVNAGTQWRLTNTGAITVGTTAITIAQFSAANPYLAGNGLTGTSTFAVLPAAGGGIVVSGSGVSVDTAIVVRKFSTTIGDGTSTTFTITHNLGTQDIDLMVRQLSSQASVEVDWSATSTSQASVVFASAPAASSYRVAVFG